MQTKKRRGRSFWAPLVAEYEGQSAGQVEFAAARGLKVGTFRSWVYRLRREDETRVGGEHRFTEVLPTGGRSGSCVVELGSARVVFEQRPSPEYLGKVLTSLAAG